MKTLYCLLAFPLPAFWIVCATAGSTATLAAAVRSRATISGGVWAGTNSADHCAKRTG